MKIISILVFSSGLFIGGYFWVERGETSDIVPHKKKTCYKFEKKPGNFRYTKNEYQNQKKQWKSDEPDFPGLIDMYLAREAYKAALKKVEEKVGSTINDKFMHCFVGCEIAKNSNYETVEYIAWLKEWRDLRDCKRTSTFDKDDYEATVLGAEIAKESQDIDSWDESVKRFGKP